MLSASCKHNIQQEQVPKFHGIQDQHKAGFQQNTSHLSPVEFSKLIVIKRQFQEQFLHYLHWLAHHVLFIDLCGQLRKRCMSTYELTARQYCEFSKGQELLATYSNSCSRIYLFCLSVANFFLTYSCASLSFNLATERAEHFRNTLW